MHPTRRRLLAAAAAVPLLGATAAGVEVYGWWDRPPGAGHLALSDAEHAFAAALAEAYLPPGGDPPLSGRDAHLADYLDSVIAHLLPGTRTELKLLLHALDDATLPTDLSRFRNLPLERRTEVLDGWLNGDLSLLRSAVQGVLVFLAEAYTTHPDVVSRFSSIYRCGFGR